MTLTAAAPRIGSLNRALDRGRLNAERRLARLEQTYERLVRAAGRDAAGMLRAQTLVAAANPDWQPPPEGILIDADELRAKAAARLAAEHERILKAMVGPALERIGISWDVSHPLAQELLAQSAQRTGAALGAAVQPVLRATIADAYTQGLSVVDAASLIRSKIADAAPAQARMLARTDLNGLANGGSVMAAKIAGVGSKVWLTAGDERVRPDHMAANGQSVPIDQPFSVGGEQLAFPGDPAGSDEQVCNCRCTVVYEDAGQGAQTQTVQPTETLGIEPFAETSPVKITARDPDVQRVTEGALRTIGSVHRIPADLGEVRISTAQTAGHFRPGEGGSPNTIKGAFSDADATATVVHEFGHYLDYELVGNGTEYGTALRPVPETIRPVFRAIKDTPTFKALPKGYLRRAEEVFARSYEQWIGTRSGDARILARIEQVRRLEDEAAFWPTDEFEAVAAAFDDFFAEKGLLVERPRVASSALSEGGRNMDAMSAAVAAPTRWQAVLAVEGEPTEDGRMLAAGSITWRELPITLMAMTKTGPGGHEGAEAAGRIDEIWRDEGRIMGAGVFDAGEFGAEIARMVREQTLRGVSVDLAVREFEVRILNDDGTAGDAVEGPLDLAEGTDALFVVTDGIIGAATVCPFQAIANASITIVGSSNAAWRIDRATEFVFTGPTIDDQIAASLRTLIDVSEIAARADYVEQERDALKRERDELRSLVASQQEAHRRETDAEKQRTLAQIEAMTARFTERKPRELRVLRDDSGRAVGYQEVTA